MNPVTTAAGPLCDLVAICGPNASGKTHLGVELARRCGGEIISVDSRQVYRGLDLGSGKDLHEYETDEGPVAYHLIDIADPDEVYSLWRFVDDFNRAFADIAAREYLPMAVGGTGLYLEAALRGYAVPEAAPDESLRRELMRLPHDALVEQLRRLDAEQCRATDTTSKKRTVRALEVAMANSGEQAAGGRRATAPANPLVVGVRWERSALRQRIATRLDQRLSAGLVEEVERLMAAGIGVDRLNQLGMEYRHVSQYLTGQVTHEQMRDDLLRSIGQLAKRQETWFRGMARRGIPVHWVEGQSMAAAADELEGMVRGVSWRQGGPHSPAT